jgi:hypothetical protein
MKLRWIGLVVAAMLVASVVAMHPAAASAPPQLASALRTLRSLTDNQFQRVVGWARSGATRPFFTSSPEERAEVAILDLNAPNRNATLAWLQGKGRSALHDRGATEAEIGSRRPARMSGTTATPTPNPYRTIHFASASLGNRSEGHIDVLGGFAAAKRDGKAAVVCVSFKNVAPKTARRVLFAFTLEDARDAKLGELELDRRGEFSTGVDINGWASLGEWQGGVGHRGYGDNCVSVQQRVGSAALLKVATATYRIVRVEYADGTDWTP